MSEEASVGMAEGGSDMWGTEMPIVSFLLKSIYCFFCCRLYSADEYHRFVAAR